MQISVSVELFIQNVMRSSWSSALRDYKIRFLKQVMNQRCPLFFLFFLMTSYDEFLSI